MTLQLIEPQPEAGVARFVQEAFLHKMPGLIGFVDSNESLRNLAKNLKRHSPSGNGSPKTFYQYVIGAYRFSRWLGKGPDQMVKECLGPEGEPLPKPLARYVKIIDDFVGALQDEGLAPGTVNNHVKGVKQLFRANGLVLQLPYRLSKRIVFKDRSPTPEEVQRLIDVADLRGKVIVSLLSIGAFRTGTLSRLQYRHVMKDLEAGTLPVHVHVEAELTKGRYADYDSFLAGEAVEYLRLYLESRRTGTPGRIASIRQGSHRIPPETITPTSPLIRDDHSAKPRPVSPQRIHDIVHDLYVRAGLLSQRTGSRYELRAHSLRKYFKTQLTSLGVHDDYVEYMMGHVLSTYHDVQMKGVEFLRGIYAASGLSIRPKTQLSKIEMLKQVARAWGLDPEKILTTEAMAAPHRSYVSSLERDESYGRRLLEELRQAVKKDLLKGEGA